MSNIHYETKRKSKHERWYVRECNKGVDDTLPLKLILKERYWLLVDGHYIRNPSTNVYIGKFYIDTGTEKHGWVDQQLLYLYDSRYLVRFLHIIDTLPVQFRYYQHRRNALINKYIVCLPTVLVPIIKGYLTSSYIQ